MLECLHCPGEMWGEGEGRFALTFQLDLRFESAATSVNQSGRKAGECGRAGWDRRRRDDPHSTSGHKRGNVDRPHRAESSGWPRANRSVISWGRIKAASLARIGTPSTERRFANH